MLKIRLRRMGSAHRPYFRVVVSDSRKVATGSALDEIGTYNPRADTGGVQLDTERLQYWVDRGAKLSSTVQRLAKQTTAG